MDFYLTADVLVGSDREGASGLSLLAASIVNRCTFDGGRRCGIAICYDCEKVMNGKGARVNQEMSSILDCDSVCTYEGTIERLVYCKQTQ